jgi:hypothetical protein
VTTFSKNIVLDIINGISYDPQLPKPDYLMEQELMMTKKKECQRYQSKKVQYF